MHLKLIDQGDGAGLHRDQLAAKLTLQLAECCKRQSSRLLTLADRL
jgi:hypothetical protein